MMAIILFDKVYSKYEKFILLFHSKNGENFPVDVIQTRAQLFLSARLRSKQQSDVRSRPDNQRFHQFYLISIYACSLSCSCYLAPDVRDDPTRRSKLVEIPNLIGLSTRIRYSNGISGPFLPSNYSI